MIQSARIIETGLVTTGLIGAGIGTGIVYGALIFSYANLGFALSEATGLFALIDNGLVALVLVAVIIGVISTVYYLGIILTMLFDKYESKKHSYLCAPIFILTLLILLFILIPNKLLNLSDILSISSYTDSTTFFESKPGFNVTFKSEGLLIITPNNKLSDIISNLSNSLYDPVISNSGANTLLDNGTIKMHKYMAYSPENHMKGLKAQIDRLSYFKDSPLTQSSGFKTDALNFNLNILFNPYASFSQDIIAFPLSISQNIVSNLDLGLAENDLNVIMTFVVNYTADTNLDGLVYIIKALIEAGNFDTLFGVYKYIGDHNRTLMCQTFSALENQTQAENITEFIKFLFQADRDATMVNQPGYGYFEIMQCIISGVSDNIRPTVSAPVTDHIASLIQSVTDQINGAWNSFVEATIDYLANNPDNQTLDTFGEYFRRHFLNFVNTDTHDSLPMIDSNLNDLVIYRIVLEDLGLQHTMPIEEWQRTHNITLVEITPEQLWYLELGNFDALDTDLFVRNERIADITDVILIIWNEYNNRNL